MRINTHNYNGYMLDTKSKAESVQAVFADFLKEQINPDSDNPLSNKSRAGNFAKKVFGIKLPQGPQKSMYFRAQDI